MDCWQCGKDIPEGEGVPNPYCNEGQVHKKCVLGAKIAREMDAAFFKSLRDEQKKHRKGEISK